MKSKSIFLSILIAIAGINFCSAQVKAPRTVVPSAVAPAPPPVVTNGPVDFVNVGQKPEFPGGQDSFSHYIQRSIHYPTTAKENNIQGRVYVAFTVSKDGSIKDVKVLKGIGGGCDEEAARVIKSMPKWAPGRLNGEVVDVRHTLPIKFTLM